MLKILVFLASPVTVALVLIGAGGVDSDFSRDVGQPPAVVAAALEQVDVVGQPHTQAKLPRADRGRAPQIVAQRDPDGLSWFVMSGEKSVLRMKAELKPSSNGASTRVTTWVEAGEISSAPESPALFSSRSEMAPLFAVAVERALGDLIPRSERSLYSLQERPWGYEPPKQAAVEGQWGPESEAERRAATSTRP